MNSGSDPLIIPKNQLSYASNSTVRGTFVSPRPPWNLLTLDFGGDADLQAAVEDGLFQGACYFAIDGEPETLVASISGRLFQFTPSGLTATVVERTNGFPQDPTVVQAWLIQAEQFVIWNDGVNLPVYFNGETNTSTRSVGNVRATIATLAVQHTFAPGDYSAAAIVLQTDVNFPLPNGSAIIFGAGSTNAVNGTITAGSGTMNITVNLNLVVTESGGRVYPVGTVFADGADFVPQFPVGKMMAYGLGRIWMALANGKDFLAGDIVLGPSGTPANDYRDSILNITENQFLFGGGVFTVPGNNGPIRAMVFTSTLDASLGQGALQVFTTSAVFSCNTPVDRTTWNTITNPILTQSLIGIGATGQNSTIQSNGDTIFRSLFGIASLILARREFSTWGNVPISREVERVISVDLQSLLPYGSAVNFDNRLLMTVHPSFSAGHGVVHGGVVAINYDPISTIRGKAPSVWDGAWPGLNALQLLTGQFDLVNRCYTFTLSEDNKIQLTEILPSGSTQFADNSDTDAIYWFFESASLFRTEDNRIRNLLCLQNGEIFVDQLQDEVSFEAFYKPDQWPCWIPWLSWTECQALTGVNDQPQFRPRMGLGTPSKSLCDSSTNRPFVNAYTFQFKLIVRGKCRFLGARFMATPVKEDTFAKPKCD